MSAAKRSRESDDEEEQPPPKPAQQAEWDGAHARLIELARRQWQVTATNRLIAQFSGFTTREDDPYDDDGKFMRWTKLPHAFRMAQLSRTHRADIQPLLTREQQVLERRTLLLRTFQQAHELTNVPFRKHNGYYVEWTWDLPDNFPHPTYYMHAEYNTPIRNVTEIWDLFLTQTYPEWDQTERNRRWAKFLELATPHRDPQSLPDVMLRVSARGFRCFESHADAMWAAAAFAYGPAALDCVKWVLLQNRVGGVNWSRSDKYRWFGVVYTLTRPNVDLYALSEMEYTAEIEDPHATNVRQTLWFLASRSGGVFVIPPAPPAAAAATAAPALEPMSLHP